MNIIQALFFTSISYPISSSLFSKLIIDILPSSTTYYFPSFAFILCLDHHLSPSFATKRLTLIE